MTNKNDSQIILYQDPIGQTKIEVKLQDETVWLSQAQMAELFQTTKQNISLHIKNVFSEQELEENSVVKEYLTTALDGKKYPTFYYNLDLINRYLKTGEVQEYQKRIKRVKENLEKVGFKI